MQKKKEGPDPVGRLTKEGKRSTVSHPTQRMTGERRALFGEKKKRKTNPLPNREKKSVTCGKRGKFKKGKDRGEKGDDIALKGKGGVTEGDAYRGKKKKRDTIYITPARKASL